MPVPPVTNPTPYTCPNCGAGLTERADFCPRCGASLHHKNAKSVAWTFSSITMGLGALLFGGIGACSGVFSYASLTAPDAELGQGLLVLSIPLLLMGLAGAFWCGLALWRRLQK